MKYSPSMEFSETQKLAETTSPVSLDTTTGMLLKSNYGEANIPIKITTESELIQKFGYPTEYNYIDWFNASGYLKNANNLYVVRPLATTASNVYMDVGYVTGTLTISVDNTQTDLYNDDIAQNTLDGITPTSGHMNIYNRHVTNKNDLAILLCTNETEYEESISKKDIFDSSATYTTIYTKSTLPVVAVNSINKTKYIVEKAVIIEGVITDIEYYTYYLNKSTTTSGVYVNTSDEISDGDRVYILGSKLAYDFSKTFTSAPAIDNYVYDVSTVYTIETLPAVTNYENDERILVKVNGTPDVWKIYEISGTSWVDSGETLTTADVILDTYNNTIYVATITDNGGSGSDTLAFAEGGTQIVYSTTFTQDTDITATDTILIKNDANGVVENVVVKYLDATLYDKDYNPKTFEDVLVSKPDFTNNEIGLVVLKKGLDNYYKIVETFVHSLTSTAKQTNGKNNYIDTNVNKFSKYIYVKSNSCSNSGATPISNNHLSVYDNTLTDSNGDYSNITDYTTLYNVANSIFGKNGIMNPELLIGYDCGDSTLLAGYLNAMPQIANDTEMSLAIVGLTRSTIGLSDTEILDEVVDDLGNRRDDTSFGALTEFNSYTFAVGQMKKYYDKYNDKYRWVSVSGDIAGMMTRNDNLFGVQSPLAGFNRGKFSNFAKMLFTSNTNQNLLSKNHINAIRFDNDYNDWYLFEYLTNTTLEEITKEANIRRMILRIKHLLKMNLKNAFFEFNNADTRGKILRKITTIFDFFKKNGGLYDYLLICDETNNTPETINANEFVLDVRLQPNRNIKHIFVNLTIYDTGVDINEG
jgi:hypothetical protein